MTHHELSDLNELGEEELPVDYNFADVKEEDCSICLEVLTEESFECPQCKKKSQYLQTNIRSILYKPFMSKLQISSLG